ncbi:MAG: DUF2117 domain-containing protein, partial [Methanomicrobiales archaeon]|nr:DUF2117 domain-containing protein [Methanomicrobiales archaeon]
HRGIPVLGVVDGDADGIVPDQYPPGSVIVHVCTGRDDDLGRDVAAMVPEGEIVWEEWIAAVLTRLAGKVRIVRFGTETAPSDADRPQSGAHYDGRSGE